MSDIIEIEHGGLIRRCGTTPPVNLVTGADFRVMAATRPNWVMDDSEIIKLIKDRKPKRLIFNDPKWMVKTNQLHWGSCQCWTVADVITFSRYLRGIDDGWIGSGSYLYSLLNNGQDHGTAVIDGLKAGYTNGTCSVDLCDANNVWRVGTKQFDDEAQKRTTLKDATFQLLSFQEIKSALAIDPLAFVNLVVEVDNGSGFASYQNGIVPAFRGIGNHSVTGFDVELVNGKVVVVVKNHWGLGWGMSGFGYITENSVIETIPVHGCWASFQTQEAGL